MKLLWAIATLTALLNGGSAIAGPIAHFDAVSYRAAPEPKLPANRFRNPVLPGFQPDPAIVRVGQDFYLVNSTFAWWPGIPVYHSRDLVNWRLLGNAIDRPEQLPIKDLGTNRAVFAPTISHYGGKFRILNTCIECGGNYLISADRPEGPWSDPVWLGFDGIDPSLFVDDDGSAWIVNNGPPEGTPRYPGHRAIWIQAFDLKTNRLFGPRKVLVDGGVHPEQMPVWAEGPHLFKHEGWYYLNAAEGGTAEDHSQTIYRSRRPDGPFEAGPINPILTQRDLPRPRPDRVEATGHADLVELGDGAWWAVFLGTRPFTGQSTLLGRETFLLPVQWKDGWPSVLEKGTPVPLKPLRPNLAKDRPVDLTRWQDRFAGPALSPEWLRLRSPVGENWVKTGHGLDLTARIDAPGSTAGQPAFLGRRLRHASAAVTATVSFNPRQAGDFAGLMAFMNEEHFVTIGIAGNGSERRIELRERRSADQGATGVATAAQPLPAAGPVDLAIDLDRGMASFRWRPAGRGSWHSLAASVDVEHMASVHAGLFTGTMIGPYAQAGS